MKKAIFTLGLFSMMMVLTSFTTDVEITHPNNFGLADNQDSRGGQSITNGKKLDFDSVFATEQFAENDNRGGESITNGKKLD